MKPKPGGRPSTGKTKNRGAVHSVEECEALAAMREQDLRAAFAGMPDRLARRLYQARSTEVIRSSIEAELQRCLAFFDMARSSR
jgi:hypothetical protein